MGHYSRSEWIERAATQEAIAALHRTARGIEQRLAALEFALESMLAREGRQVLDRRMPWSRRNATTGTNGSRD